ncbi:MAG: T9SS type A sorting domain-containing protein, partial [Bacteroidales bacterium]|nr:T9SS type A sorting domain-containing protein [Bacteroidales bacterium]
QVVDVTGRILKSETINGCANVNVNAAPGVYMLRLINGNNVKVQKVVVK